MNGPQNYQSSLLTLQTSQVCLPFEPKIPGFVEDLELDSIFHLSDGFDFWMKN